MVDDGALKSMKETFGVIVMLSLGFVGAKLNEVDSERLGKVIEILDEVSGVDMVWCLLLVLILGCL